MLFSEEELELAAATEWAEEMGDKTTMNFDTFYTAIFEIVDLWTMGLDEELYIEFLKLTWRQVRVTLNPYKPRCAPLEGVAANWVWDGWGYVGASCSVSVRLSTHPRQWRLQVNEETS
jgi:hypothetical protein